MVDVELHVSRRLLEGRDNPVDPTRALRVVEGNGDRYFGADQRLGIDGSIEGRQQLCVEFEKTRDAFRAVKRFDEQHIPAQRTGELHYPIALFQIRHILTCRFQVPFEMPIRSIKTKRCRSPHAMVPHS